jgi:hypothetical protein
MALFLERRVLEHEERIQPALGRPLAAGHFLFGRGFRDNSASQLQTASVRGGVIHRFCGKIAPLIRDDPSFENLDRPVAHPFRLHDDGARRFPPRPMTEVIPWKITFPFSHRKSSRSRTKS